MAGKQPEKRYPSTGVFRDSSAQNQYREQSTSQYKDEKEASHIVSLQIAKAALNDHRPPGRPPAEEAEDVKALLNHPSNFRMVSIHTNRMEHVRLDNAIIRKAETGEQLTVAEEERARLQVAVIQARPVPLDAVTYDSFQVFYRKLNIESGVVWDAGHD